MGLEEKLPSGFLLSTVEEFRRVSAQGSVWPATFGLACCAIEMMATGAGRFDIARFGMEAFRASPRQADLMIVAGRVSQKMAPVAAPRSMTSMTEPKWVLAMGVCASSGGMFNNYAIVQGVDHVVPVDIYLPGCPPRPEMLLNAILALHAKIQEIHWASTGTRPCGPPNGPRWHPRDHPNGGSAAMTFDSPPTTDSHPPEDLSEAVTRVPEGTPPVEESAPAGAEVIGVRRGMFGASAAATPPATASWSGR